MEEEIDNNNGQVKDVVEEPKKKKVKKGPPQKRDPTLPQDSPFTAEELAITCSVLTKLGNDGPNLNLFQSAACRELRKIMEPLVKFQIRKRSKEVGGERVGHTEGSAIAQRTRHAREQQKKLHDRELINKRHLRAERLNQLKAMSTIDPRLPMIPDGAVFDGVNHSLGQSQGTSSCVATVQNSGAMTKSIEDMSVKTGTYLDDIVPIDELCVARACYVCKCRFYKLHHFYDSLCPQCAELNWNKRMQTIDMTGRIVLLTGGRVKVGYHIALKVLRAGATLIMTTRFPTDAAERFSREIDFVNFKSRLKLYGIDFRDLVAVEHLCEQLNRTLPRLDVIINNACQTVRRPPAYYSHLIANEKKDKFPELIMEGSVHGMSRRDLILVGNDAGHLELENDTITSSTLSSSSSSTNKGNKILPSELTQVPLLASDVTENSEKLFPKGAFDVNAQQIDFREHTSWTLRLHEVSTPEAIEVMAVNTLAPMIVTSRLKQLMINTKKADEAKGLLDVGRYVVNVSSMEGKFCRRKDVVHPHTNMAKAALNMMTRTSGADYQEDDIYMTSVDTGWLSIEAPVPTAIKIVQKNFQTPIDEVDGASRVLDPVFTGMQTMDKSKRLWGVFLKDYFETEW